MKPVTISDYFKVMSTIHSCTTQPQLTTASRLVNLFTAKHQDAGKLSRLLRIIVDSHRMTLTKRGIEDEKCRNTTDGCYGASLRDVILDSTGQG